jgi:hypothetical protein
MYQLAFSNASNLECGRLIQKKQLEDHDLQAVAEIVCDGLREGLYTNLVPNGKRFEVIQFLRHLAKRCEIWQSSEKCFRKRVAALWVYTVEGVVVGFSVLAQTVSQAVDNGIDLLMFGVAHGQRGLGYGAGILDYIVRTVPHHGFNLMVRCPSDSQLLFAMLVTRSFNVVSRYAQGRVMRYSPISGRRASVKSFRMSRYI